MDISQVTSTSTTSTLQTEAAETVISSDFETFLRMLTVQMENQDPLDPTDSSEYAMQLATFSSVEQQVLTNDLLASLTSQITTSGLSQMADWVGNEARAAMPAYFSGTPITVAPNPAAAADYVELVVYDADGNEVERTEIPVSADPVEWAGTSADGSPLANGLYQFNIESYSNDELILESISDVYATVTEVRSQTGNVYLMMAGDVSILASEVNAVRGG